MHYACMSVCSLSQCILFAILVHCRMHYCGKVINVESKNIFIILTFYAGRRMYYCHSLTMHVNCLPVSHSSHCLDIFYICTTTRVGQYRVCWGIVARDACNLSLMSVYIQCQRFLCPPRSTRSPASMPSPKSLRIEGEGLRFTRFAAC